MVGGSVGYVGSCRWVGEVDLSRFATLSVIKVGIELLGWLKHYLANAMLATSYYVIPWASVDQVSQGTKGELPRGGGDWGGTRHLLEI